MKISQDLKKQAIFVLEDDIELMSCAIRDYPDNGMRKQDIHMNKIQVNSFNKSIKKIENNLELNKKDIENINEANQIHVNNEDKTSIKLEKFINNKK